MSVVDELKSSSKKEVDSEGELENSLQPRHLPPKHLDKPDAPFPYLNMYPDRPNPRDGIPIEFLNKRVYSASDIIFSSDGLSIKNMGNYKVALANYGVTTGTYYFEVKILNLPSSSNLRIGVGQINTSKQAPLGFDGFSYAYRASPSTLFHRSRPYDVLGEAAEKDVIGVLIHLPALTPIEEKEVSFRVWDKNYTYAQFSYEKNRLLTSKLNPLSQSKDGKESLPVQPFPPQTNYNFPDPFKKFDQLPILPNSQLVYFVNGKMVSNSFKNLILGKYHPAVSLYKGAKVKVNFGAVKFDFPPPKVWNPELTKQDHDFGFTNVEQPVLPFQSLYHPLSPPY